MVASENPEVIEGRRWLIDMYFLDSEEEDYYGSTDNDGTYFDEEDDSGSVEASLRTGFTQSGTE